ncbi:NADH-ubiquinone oxidoreductase kDa subunit [Hyphodiscus hymeniophilus]|uniref:NADH-ubiquinone oxidoreductase kDa subunit n=1 Tax=Hyphodiscus hymeniophilus TaxID=353542 RepID=A0A9P6VGE4_9HELO|nr:NADH-ubiquinone oxidoreductase kDa subunit [Hyphodiscus hymeniophilus]
MAPEGERYHPKDAVKAAINGTLIVGSAGLAVSAIQNTLTKRNVSAWGVFTRTGGTAALFAAMGGTYEFTRFASANLREKDDSLNPAIGGFLAGALMGIRSGSTPAVFGFGALTAVVLGAYDYTGGSLTGYKKDPEMDEFERKEHLRKNRRRPIEETINELGEGRGIYGPGYQERRAERIKENYGIEVPKS